MNMVTKLLICLVSVLLAASVMATPVDTYEFKTTENQQRALSLAHQLRCPQCQNQNLVDSNSPVAQDLRLEVYKMVDNGKSDAEIIDFMTSRYGDFVLYKPKLDSKTYVLWLGPIGLLVFGLFIGFIFVRRQRIQPAEADSLSPEQQAELDALLKESKANK
ncbi:MULTISPECIES: heme lyase NrfEFG subunit NrfF [Shewanella]|jgi:formate-dependent nitrite reductase complex subunit NrfF|uniref:heme lyase NrfEFG subunit NrfF n=1 Tax=Shewanella TaxID=22 RepID=UPI00200CE614|nr:heme lyase NrfEFG subunit NrfF [Shewanella basaltis]MCL1115333.1 heme lyase NrfEFG subunit NrfF [Shewanella basaltis]